MHIVIIGSDDHWVGNLSWLLEQKGSSVEPFENFSDVLKYFKTHTEADCDLIIMGLITRDGVQTVRLIEELRGRNSTRNIPIIYYPSMNLEQVYQYAGIDAGWMESRDVAFIERTSATDHREIDVYIMRLQGANDDATV